MNLATFARTARKVYAPVIRSSAQIQTGLTDIQQRNDARQAQLKADYAAEPARINSLLGK